MRRRALPGNAVDAQAASEQVDVRAEHRIRLPGGDDGRAVAHDGSEQRQEALIAEELQPGGAIAIVAAVVVALDGDNGNVALFEFAQALDGMDEGLRIDGALVEQISGDNQEIDAAFDRVIGDLPEGAAKVVEALAHAVLLVAQVCIGNMDKRRSHESLYLSTSALALNFCGFNTLLPCRKATGTRPVANLPFGLETPSADPSSRRESRRQPGRGRRC